MRAGTLTTILLAAGLASAGGAGHGGHAGHSPFSRRHTHHHHKKGEIAKREGQCKFPGGPELVAITPSKMNAGWAMAPDMPCKPGMYCPYACKSGKLMAQWDPDAKTYSYPQSQNGGLYCDENGEMHKPFEDKPYCVDGVGTVRCNNKASKSVAFCQTVLPGYEDMLIPTDVNGQATLAVPDPNYWASTSAHYYINPPGVSTQEGCVWGTKDKPHGNWTPYVAGANQDHKGETFVTLGWNPIYLEEGTPFRNVVPEYGVRIDCDGDCTGLPCEIDPSKHKVNGITKPGSTSSARGAGGANFCVVGVTKGSHATIEVFTAGGGDGLKGGDKEKEVAPPPPPKVEAPGPAPILSPKAEEDESIDDNEHDAASSKIHQSPLAPTKTATPAPSASPVAYSTGTSHVTGHQNGTVISPTIALSPTTTSGASSLRFPTVALLVTVAVVFL